MVDTAEIPSADSQSADVQSCSAAILREGRLTELPAASAEAPLPLYDAEDRDVLVQKDLAFVHVVRSERGVLVQGDVCGTAEQSIRIEAKGDIVVIGSARHAQFTGRRVMIGGSILQCQVTVAQRISVGGTLDSARIVTGDYEDDRRRIESCRLTLEQEQVQVEAVARRVITEEKRLDKTCKALRIPLDFNVGRIVQHEDGRVSVNLNSFYGSLEGRTDEQLELALAEFFAKGVIGVITRANRKYLVNFPAREKVFMQLVRSLRELFEAVFERDRLQRRVDWLADRLEDLVDSLCNRRCRIDVRGAIAGITAMEFILPQVVQQPKASGYDFFHKTARLEVHSTGATVDVVSCSSDGERMSTTLTPPEMEGLRFSVAENRVLWNSVGEPVPA